MRPSTASVGPASRRPWPGPRTPWPSTGGEAYRLDSASIFAAETLDLPESGEILDACAAPGGKSIVLATRMLRRLESEGLRGGASEARPGLRLVANELSSDRRRRLSEALDRSLCPAARSLVVVSGEDAGAMCRRNSGRFAAILLDAPCSSERHVLGDPAALAAWSPSRPRALATRQWALLSSAFLMLAPGGSLVYSTCALNPEENDGVARRLSAKYGGQFDFDPPEPSRLASAGAEATEFGLFIAPDLAGGAGPMYVCRIRKRPANSAQ